MGKIAWLDVLSSNSLFQYFIKFEGLFLWSITLIFIKQYDTKFLCCANRNKNLSLHWFTIQKAAGFEM